MITLELKELEERVKQRLKDNEDIMKSFQKDLLSRDVIKGRVRPKDPTEIKILASFSKK